LFLALNHAALNHAPTNSTLAEGLIAFPELILLTGGKLLGGTGVTVGTPGITLTVVAVGWTVIGTALVIVPRLECNRRLQVYGPALVKLRRNSSRNYRRCR